MCVHPFLFFPFLKKNRFEWERMREKKGDFFSLCEFSINFSLPSLDHHIDLSPLLIIPLSLPLSPFDADTIHLLCSHFILPSSSSSSSFSVGERERKKEREVSPLFPFFREVKSSSVTTTSTVFDYRISFLHNLPTFDATSSSSSPSSPSSFFSPLLPFIFFLPSPPLHLFSPLSPNFSPLKISLSPNFPPLSPPASSLSTILRFISLEAWRLNRFFPSPLFAKKLFWKVETRR